MDFGTLKGMAISLVSCFILFHMLAIKLNNGR